MRDPEVAVSVFPHLLSLVLKVSLFTKSWVTQSCSRFCDKLRATLTPPRTTRRILLSGIGLTHGLDGSTLGVSSFLVLASLSVLLFLTRCSALDRFHQYQLKNAPLSLCATRVHGHFSLGVTPRPGSLNISLVQYQAWWPRMWRTTLDKNIRKDTRSVNKLKLFPTKSLHK